MTKWHTHLHVAGFAGENNYRLLSGSRFLGLCDSGSGVHSLFHTKRHNLKKKKKKYSFSNKNGCFISRRRRGNVRPVACKIIVFWMFKPFANEREIFFNDGFSFMGHMELWILPLFRGIRSPLGWGKHCECVAQSGAHLQCWEVVWHFHFYPKNKNAIKRACFWIVIYYVQTRYILYFQLSLLSKYNKDKMKLKFALMVSCVIMW